MRYEVLTAVSITNCPWDVMPCPVVDRCSKVDVLAVQWDQRNCHEHGALEGAMMLGSEWAWTPSMGLLSMVSVQHLLARMLRCWCCVGQLDIWDLFVSRQVICWYLRSSGMLGSIDRRLVNDVSGQPVDPISWRWNLQVVLKRRLLNISRCCITSQKSEDLIYTVEETWNHIRLCVVHKICRNQIQLDGHVSLAVCPACFRPVTAGWFWWHSVCPVPCAMSMTFNMSCALCHWRAVHIRGLWALFVKYNRLRPVGTVSVCPSET